jgi:hypothetical protein
VSCSAFEDETATENVILWPAVFNRLRKPARTAAGLIVEDRLQKQVWEFGKYFGCFRRPPR